MTESPIRRWIIKTIRLFWGGIEGGGTKFNCIVASDPDNIVADIRIPTTTPEETIEKSIQFFRNVSKDIPLAGIGLGSFGPIDLDQNSPTYGFITDTPKPGWSNTDIVGHLEKELNIPVAFDTDVNAAALGEHHWGAGRDLDSFIYLTIGTGIGGGGLINGKLMHGLLHPEMGHVLLPHNLDNDPFPGICPFHKDCFEGLASGPAMKERWGEAPENLPEDHPAWDLEAHYISLGVMGLILSISPKRVILGGGVMNYPGMYAKVQNEVVNLLNQYVKKPEITDYIGSYIVPPELGSKSGRLGAIALIQSKFRINA